MSPAQPHEAFGKNESADAAGESAARTSFGVEDILRWKERTGRMPEKLEQALGRLKGKENREEALTEIRRMKEELLAFLRRNDRPLLESDRERILAQMRSYEDLDQLFAKEGAEKILYGAFFREWLGDAGQAEECAGRYVEREHSIPFAEARMLLENVWRLMRELREDVTPAMRAELAALLSEGREEELIERHGALLGRKILKLNDESEQMSGEVGAKWQTFSERQNELATLMKRKDGEGREKEMEELSGEVGRLSNEFLYRMKKQRGLQRAVEEDTAALLLIQDRLLRPRDEHKADTVLLKGALALPVETWSAALADRVAEARSRLRGEGSIEKQFSSSERGILALEKPDDVLRSSLQRLRDTSLPLEVRAQLEYASETRAPAFSLEACGPEELVGLKGDRIVRPAAVTPAQDRIQGWGAEQNLCRIRKPDGGSAIAVRGEGIDARLAQCPSGFTPVLLHVPPSLQFQESGSVQISHRVPGSGHGNVYVSLPIFTIREQPESILSPEDIGFARREIGAGEVISLRRHDGEEHFSREDFQRAEHARGEVHTALLHLPAMRAMQDGGREVLARFLPLQNLFEAGMMRAGTVLRSGERGWKFQSFVEESRKLANDLYEAYLQSGLMSSYREMKETAAELRSLPKGLMTDAFEEELLAIERQLDAVAALVEGNAIMKLREGILSHSNDPDTYFEYLGGKEFTILMAAIAAGVLAGMAVPTGGASAGVGIFLLRNVLIAAGGHAGSEYMKTWLSAGDERVESDVQRLFQGEMELDEYLAQTLSQIGAGAMWSSVLIGVGGRIGRAARQIEHGERAANLAQRVMARAITKSSDMLGKVDSAIAGIAPGARGPFATYMREVAEETVEELTENLAASLAANADEAGSEVGAGLLRALGTGLVVLNCAKGKPGNLTGIGRAGDAVTLRYAYDGSVEKLEAALRDGGYPTVQPDGRGVVRFEEIVGDGERKTSVVHEFRLSKEAAAGVDLLQEAARSGDTDAMKGFIKQRDSDLDAMERIRHARTLFENAAGKIGLDLDASVIEKAAQAVQMAHEMRSSETGEPGAIDAEGNEQLNVRKLKRIADVFRGAGVSNENALALARLPMDAGLAGDPALSLVPKRIIETNEFERIKQEHGFESVRHGTYRSTKEGLFLYTKYQYIVSSEQQARENLALVRYLTECGIFHPDTQWGIYKNQEGKYQIFAIGKELVVGTKMPQHDWQHILSHEEVRKRLGHDASEIEWYQALSTDPKSHILDWYRRIEPNFDPLKECPNPLVKLLNFFEASHMDNWGWDPQTGRLYPIDMEVVNVHTREEIYPDLPDLLVDIGQGIVHDWTKSTEGQRYLFSAGGYKKIRSEDRLVPLESEAVPVVRSQGELPVQDVLHEVLENIRKNGEVYVHGRFYRGETPHDFEEYQTTANERAFSKYDARLEINYKGQFNTYPMHLQMMGNLQTDWGYEQIVGCRPHFDGKQWVVYYRVGGVHGGKDTRPGIELGIGVSFPTKGEAEAILNIFEKNPPLIRPFFLEAGKEAKGEGVKKVLSGTTPRTPAFDLMQQKFLVMREDEENFKARYIDRQGNDIQMKPELQQLIEQASRVGEGNRRKRLSPQKEKKSWWKFWE